MAQQGQCMQELALMFHWASLAGCHMRLWQAHVRQQLWKKLRWVKQCHDDAVTCDHCCAENTIS